MASLFTTNEELAASPAVVGYKVLKHLRTRRVSRMSIFDIADHLVDEKWFDVRHLYLALVFLFTVGLIDLNGSYVVVDV